MLHKWTIRFVVTDHCCSSSHQPSPGSHFYRHTSDWLRDTRKFHYSLDTCRSWLCCTL